MSLNISAYIALGEFILKDTCRLSLEFYPRYLRTLESFCIGISSNSASGKNETKTTRCQGMEELLTLVARQMSGKSRSQDRLAGPSSPVYRSVHYGPH